jgi:8-oxo-dGTP pyrophosphatase MutT (NUDIX family)
MNLNELSIEEITKRLSDYRPSAPFYGVLEELLGGSPRSAAVLVPLLRQNDQWHLLFIRRTEIQGDRHSGQVAFPGGARDDGDENIEAAALREACEELGINPNDVQILGRLNDFITISNYRVTPVVGMIPWPYQLKLSPEEVSKAFTIPLNWLNEPENREETERELPGNTKISVIFYKKYDDEVLWGASARFTLHFLNVIQDLEK